MSIYILTLLLGVVLIGLAVFERHVPTGLLGMAVIGIGLIAAYIT